MGITQSMFEERENELSASAPGASAAMTCARVSFVEDIPGSLECAVCCEPKERPVFAGCRKHSFCKKCLKEWASKFPTRAQMPCPVCRAKFSALSSKKFAVDEKCQASLCAFIVESCPCKNSFTLNEHREHVESCEKHKEYREATAVALELAKEKDAKQKLQSTYSPVTNNVRSNFRNVVYACPLCPDGFEHTFTATEAFTRHVISRHGTERESCVCPICAAMPWGSPDYICQNFVAHVSLRHRFTYEDFTSNLEEEERDFQYALNISAQIELGNESPIEDDEESDDDASVSYYARVRT